MGGGPFLFFGIPIGGTHEKRKGGGLFGFLLQASPRIPRRGPKYTILFGQVKKNLQIFARNFLLEYLLHYLTLPESDV
jgi:hypothetical protein